MSDVLWKTGVAGQIDGTTVVRGYPLDDLIGNISFPETIYLVLKGELPSKPEAKMMNAMLTACIDHGIAPPSVVAARTVFSGGNSLNSAVAAGALTLGDFHGGAIEQCMKLYGVGGRFQGRCAPACQGQGGRDEGQQGAFSRLWA